MKRQVDILNDDEVGYYPSSSDNVAPDNLQDFEAGNKNKDAGDEKGDWDFSSLLKDLFGDANNDGNLGEKGNNYGDDSYYYSDYYSDDDSGQSSGEDENNDDNNGGVTNSPDNEADDWEESVDNDDVNWDDWENQNKDNTDIIDGNKWDEWKNEDNTYNQNAGIDNLNNWQAANADKNPTNWDGVDHDNDLTNIDVSGFLPSHDERGSDIDNPTSGGATEPAQENNENSIMGLGSDIGMYLGGNVTTPAPTRPATATPYSSTPAAPKPEQTTPPRLPWLEDTSICNEPALINDYCVLPDELGDVLGWDVTLHEFYNQLFDNETVEQLMAGCKTGTWCLSSTFGVEKLRRIWSGEFSRSAFLCWPGLSDCIRSMVDLYLPCESFEKLDIMAASLYTMCDVTQNDEISQSCVQETITSLQISMADILRYDEDEFQKNDDSYSFCDNSDTRMGGNLWCLTSQCPVLSYIYSSNVFWEPMFRTMEEKQGCYTLEDYCWSRPSSGDTSPASTTYSPPTTTYTEQTHKTVPYTHEAPQPEPASTDFPTSTRHVGKATEAYGHAAQGGIDKVEQPVLSNTSKEPRVGMMIGIGLGLVALVCALSVTAMVFRRRKLASLRHRYNTDVEYTQIPNEQ